LKKKLKFKVNLIKSKRIKGLKIKMKELLKFKDPGGSIKGSIEKED